MVDQIPRLSLPETGAGDLAEVLVAGALSLVPGVGGWLSSGVQKVFAQQEQERVYAYLNEIAAVVNALIEGRDDLSPERLAETPEFYDAAAKAVRIATMTSSREKHRMLQNALYHVGLATADDVGADLRSVFLRCIEDLTDTHIRMLREFAQHGEAYKYIADLAPIAGGEAEAHIFAADLQVRGLIEERPIFTRQPGGSMTVFADAVKGGSRISALGTEFLNFIAGPFG